MTSELQKDLQAASASGIELAGSQRDYQPTRVVSAIEQPQGMAPAPQRKAPRRVPRQVANNVPEQATAPAPEAPPVVEAAPMPSPTPTVDAPAPSVEPAVVLAPRPTAVPVAMPSTGTGGGAAGSTGSGGGIGEAIGVIIGTVIIRGGAGGVDHCDPRRDGRRGSPGATPNFGIPPYGGSGTAINDRLPRHGIPRR
jgi:hypothetical protein